MTAKPAYLSDLGGRKKEKKRTWVEECGGRFPVNSRYIDPAGVGGKKEKRKKEPRNPTFSMDHVLVSLGGGITRGRKGQCEGFIAAGQKRKKKVRTRRASWSRRHTARRPSAARKKGKCSLLLKGGKRKKGEGKGVTRCRPLQPQDGT